MKFTLYPTLNEALELHARLVDRFGGATGVRDLGLIYPRPHNPWFLVINPDWQHIEKSHSQKRSCVSGYEGSRFAP